MDLATWIVVSLAAGGFGALVVGPGGGIGVGVALDVVVGAAGAFLGGWVFHEAGWQAPFVGLAGHVSLAVAGAIVLVLALRIVRGPPRALQPSSPRRVPTGHRSLR